MAERRLPQISVGILLLFSPHLADSARTAETASLAVLVRAEPGSQELAGKLRPLLEAEAARQWQGHVVERAELDKLLAELKLAAAGGDDREQAGGDFRLQFGKLSHADCLLTARVTSTGVEATVTRFPATAVIHEQAYRRRLEPDCLAVRIVTDALKAFREKDRDPKRPYVSVGSFYYADPHRRFFQFSHAIGAELRRRLAQKEQIVLAERWFPSQLVTEFELARTGMTTRVARNLSAPAADVLLYGRFQPQPDQELNSTAAVLDCTLVVLSPTGLCRKRKAEFSCRSDEPQEVIHQALKLVAQSAAEVQGRLAAGGKRGFSQQEFDAFKQQAFRLMPTPPLEEGVFYRQRSYRGPVQFGKPEEFERALRMLECAMLFKGDDTQVLVCTGAVLDGLARSGKYSGPAKDSLLAASLEVIDRAYRLKSNWNTRGMYWRFCMSGSRSPAERPPCSVEAARRIWSTRQTEPWHLHEIRSAFSTLFDAEADPQKQQAMFLQAAPEHEAEKDGLRELFSLFGAFTDRVYKSDGDPETLRQAGAFAQRLSADQSAFLRALGHLLYLAVYREMGEAKTEPGVPAEFAAHFRAAVNLLPKLHEVYGKELIGCDYSYRLREFFDTYEQVVEKHGLNHDVAQCMERYIGAQMRAGNYNGGGIVQIFRKLLPLMLKSRQHARAHGLLTQFLDHYDVGGSADYERMWLARERNRFAFAMQGGPPLRIDGLEKIGFDDGRTDWVTKVMAAENAVFGIRNAQWYHRGQVFRIAPGARQADILKDIPGPVCDLACSDGTVGIATESGGFYLLDSHTLAARHLTPQNSGLPGSRVRLVCSHGKDFLVALPDKENLYALVYRLQPEAGRISRTDTKFVPHAYWRMKANTADDAAGPVVPQTWYHRTAVADGKTLEFLCGPKVPAIKQVTVTSDRKHPLLRYQGFELSYVFDFAQWQGRLIFATGSGLYVSEPGSNEIHCLLSEPDLLFFCLCPLDDRMYLGTSKGLYSLEANLFRKMTAGMLVSSARSTPGADQQATRPEPKARGLTAAFVDLDRSPLSGLIEAGLLESPGVAWLERNQVDDLLRERKLTSLLAPEAGRQRSSVGKLLKADVLVLLRRFEEPKEHVQLVVCETGRGLRLAVHRVVPSPSVEKDVPRLSALVERAIAKHGQEIREICAVPPFVSNDLTYENEHLKAAYGKLAEQTIRDRPGLLTVELEEARAIAREVGLAAEGVRRSIPLYLLGEFRHEGKGERRTATLRMRVMRGERVLASRNAAGLSPPDAAKFVQQAANELIEQTLGIRPLPPNPVFEARQLAARAETFHQLGSWAEAAGLAEASLLLDNSQTRMHEVAASSLASLARRHADYRKGPETVARGIHLYFRALEHYETLLPEIADVRKDHHRRLLMRLWYAARWPDLFNKYHSPADVQRLAAELRKRELEILLRVVRARCRAATGDEHVFMEWALYGRAPQDRAAILLATLRAVQHYPHAERLTREFTVHGWTLAKLDSPEGRRYLQRLMAIDSRAVQRAAVELRDRLRQYVSSKAEQPPEKPAGAPPAAPHHVRFEPVKIDYPPQGSDLPGFRLFGGWIPAGPGCDLVWAGRRLYVMKQPGRLEPIWDAASPGPIKARITGADYDGRFAWVTTQHAHMKPRLLVVEPQRERIWEIEEDAGLPVVAPETIPDPQVHPRLWVEPLEPGRILLVSFFGRIAIGTVTFDPQKRPDVELFFEARHRLDSTKGEPWRDLQMAFPPGYMIGFRGADEQGRPLRRILVGIHDQYAQYGRHDRPLVVDPESKHVDVLPHQITSGIEPHRVAFTPDALYRIQVYHKELRLERIGLPDLKPETLMTGVPEGYLMKCGERFVVLGSRCWLVDPQGPPEERVRVIAARPPWKYSNGTEAGAKFVGEAAEPPKELLPFRFARLWGSNHFGLLAARHSIKHGYEFFRVVFDEP